MELFLVNRLHGGEQDDFANCIGIGEHHHAAINANAQTTRWRHAILQSGKEIFVHHTGLVVALVPQLHLFLESLALVDGVVELGEGIAHLAVADK